MPFEGELETLVDSHIVSRHRLAYIYPPLLQGHKANLNPTVSYMQFGYSDIFASQTNDTFNIFEHLSAEKDFVKSGKDLEQSVGNIS